MVDTTPTPPTKSKLRASAAAFVFSPNAPSWQPTSFVKPAPTPAAPVVPTLKPTAKEFVPSFLVTPPVVVAPVEEPVVVEAEPVVEPTSPVEVVKEEAVVIETPPVEPFIAICPAKVEPEEETQPSCLSPTSDVSTETTSSPSDNDKEAAVSRKRRITYTVAEMLKMEPEVCPVPTGLVICLAPPGDSKAARAAYNKDAKPERSERKKSSKKHKHHSKVVEEDLPPVKPLSINEETRWKPKGKRSTEDEATQSSEEYLKQVQAILNKLSVEKFERLSDQLIDVAVKNAEVLQGSIDMVVKKAQMEWHFSAMYADLCGKMARTEMPLMEEENTSKLFRTLLLTRCQKEFEVTPLTALDTEGLTDETKEEKTLILKRATLGHIRFIGELYKIGMLSARIMHECIQRLFGNLDSPDEESLECMCKLLATIGLRLEERAAAVPQEAALIKQYYDLIATLSKSKDKLCTRVRFMLQDLIDLRANKYVARIKEAKATTIAEVHAQAAREEKSKNQAPQSAPKPKFFKSQSMAVLPPAPMSAPSKDGWEVVPQKVKLIKSVSADIRPPPRSEKRNDDRKTRSRRGSVERDRRVPLDRRNTTSDRPNIPRTPQDLPPRSVAPAASSRPTSPTPVVASRSEDDVVKATKSMFKEFVSENDIAEVVSQLHDAAGHSQAVTTVVLNYAMDQKDAERQAAGPFLAGLAAQNQLETVGLVASFNELLEFLEDIEIDIPKAGQYLSEMAAPLLAASAISLDQLNLAPLSEGKQGELKSHLALFLLKMEVTEASLLEFISAHH